MSRRDFVKVSAALAVGTGASVLSEAKAATRTLYYASPTGHGDGRSEASPFRITDFWTVAQPGDTLLLLDGKYAGAKAMINPPKGLKGRQGKPIAIKALNDGRVLIDGEGRHRPVRLYHNDYFIIEGINACRSSDTVVESSRSNYNIARRICAWDAADGNTNIFAAHYGEHNLFEDCAGWGIARKTYSNSQGGNYTTYRRCWGRWEGSHVVGPKMTYSCFYNSHHIVLESCIGTWDARKMRESYVLLDYDGKPFVKKGSKRYGVALTLKNYEVDQPYGIFSADNYYPNIEMPRNGPYLYGCIAYVLPAPKLRSFSGVFQIGWGRGRDDGRIENCLAYVHPAVTTVGSTFSLFRFRGRNLTAVGGSIQFKASQIESVRQSDTGHDIVAERGHLLDTPGGASMVYRYENGKLTDKPLWPWPMNQRIIDAMRLAGYDALVDVTKTIFELAGGKMPDFEERSER